MDPFRGIYERYYHDVYRFALEPERTKTFDLKITAADPTAIRKDLEQLLRRSNVRYELGTAGPKELVYEAQLPLTLPTNKISNAILKLKPSGETEVVWEEKK